MSDHDLVSKYVRAFSGVNRSDTVAEGRVIAYSSRPQVCIEAEDGTRTWWVADITEEIMSPEALVIRDELTFSLDRGRVNVEVLAKRIDRQLSDCGYYRDRRKPS